MAKRKIETKQTEPYVPQPDTKIYVYIQKHPNRLTPVPYKNKTDYKYILNLVRELPKH